MVWRISDDAPMGQWVPKLPQVPQLKKSELPEVTHGNWVGSSFDLLNGTDVVENEDTIPGDLFDELFASPSEKSGSTRK